MPTALSDTSHDLNGAGAQSPASAKRHVPGEPGVWVFILGDMLVFAVLFCVFMHYRDRQPVVFAHSQAMLHRSFGAINTLLLLTSSLCVATAIRAIRAQKRRLAPILAGVAFLCGCLFLMNKGLEWSSLLSDGHSPASNSFFMYFFVLTGIHAFHLLIGMGVLATLFVLSRRPSITRNQYMLIEGGACFWHLVDLLWIVLFALLYLVR